jgi:hypothetical protein
MHNGSPIGPIWLIGTLLGDFYACAARAAPTQTACNMCGSFEREG